jgi:hypothetical protein
MHSIAQYSAYIEFHYDREKNKENSSEERYFKRNGRDYIAAAEIRHQIEAKKKIKESALNRP